MVEVFGQYVGFMPLEVAFDLEEAELLDQTTLTRNGYAVAELSTYEDKPCLVYFHNQQGSFPTGSYIARFREDQAKLVIVEV